MDSDNTIQYYKFNTEVHGQFVGWTLIGTYILKLEYTYEGTLLQIEIIT